LEGANMAVSTFYRFGLLWLICGLAAAAWQENVRPIMYVQLGKSMISIQLFHQLFH